MQSAQQAKKIAPAVRVVSILLFSEYIKETSKNLMTDSAIYPYPIRPIADISVDKSLAAALLTSIADHRQQLRGRRIWLACSGGRDSLALAALCVQLYQQGQLPFLPQLLHVDHGLQADSALWANHVVQWAKTQQLPCTVLKAQVQGRDEQAARLARYKVMRAHINQGDVLILAHHADDQAETVLMRLIQGAGVKGLSAMQPWREQSKQGRHDVLWRPWLSITRATISHYAQRLALPYIDDPTNESGDNVRSSLRRDIMPVLATYNSNVIDNIARSAQLLSDAQATVAERAEQDRQGTIVESLCYGAAQQVLAIDPLQTLPLHRQRQLLHHWLSQYEPLPPSKQLVDDVYALTQRPDNDHKTELNWYASHQTYRISRYRQQLYRLSYDFLSWLTLPVTEQHHSLKAGTADSRLMTVTVRASAHYKWQLQIDRQKIDQDIQPAVCDENYDIYLKIAPLERQQKIQTVSMGRAQAGKKLYQTLGIPIWLRESVVVLSILSKPQEPDDGAVLTKKSAVNFLLLSPFASWVLIDSHELTSAIDPQLLTAAISQALQVNDNVDSRS